jgi:hypothetical protein
MHTKSMTMRLYLICLTTPCKTLVSSLLTLIFCVGSQTGPRKEILSFWHQGLLMNVHISGLATWSVLSGGTIHGSMKALPISCHLSA